MIPLNFLNLASRPASEHHAERVHGRTRAQDPHGRACRHARPAQLHCCRGKPGLRREVGRAPACAVRRLGATQTRIGLPDGETG